MTADVAVPVHNASDTAASAAEVALSVATDDATDVYDYLQRLDNIMRLADEMKTTVVVECRRHNVPWSTIGELLGCSAQAANKRYSRHVAEEQP